MATADTIAPPDGFVLDSDTTPPPPDGFTIDPEPSSATAMGPIQNFRPTPWGPKSPDAFGDKSLLDYLPDKLKSAVLFNPALSLASKIPGVVGNVAKGVSAGTQDLETSLTTPNNAAMMLAMPEGNVGKIVSAVFAGQAAYSGAKEFKPFVEAVKSKDWEEAAKLGTSILGSGAIAGLAGKQALLDVKPLTTGEPDAIEKTEVPAVPNAEEQRTGVPQQESSGQAGAAPTQVRPDETVTPNETPIPAAPETPAQPTPPIAAAPTPNASTASAQALPVPPEGFVVDQTVDKPAVNVVVEELPDGFKLSAIGVPKELQGKGAGSAAIRDLISKSDATGKPIFTTAHAQTAELQPKLNQFYERLGFKQFRTDPLSGKPMYRYDPKPAEAPVAPAGATPPQYGIAERVRDERAKAGVAAPVEPGEGIAPQDSVEAGRDALSAGADPEAAMKAFEKTKRFNAADIGLFRAQGEKLAKAADATLKSNGEGSPEYKAAKESADAWEARSKGPQTEWSNSGKAQQGATDLDTGSFTALRQAHEKASGKPFTPKQSLEAEKIADSNTKAQADADAAKQRLYEASDAPVDPKVKSIADRIIATLDKTAGEALARIKARRQQVQALGVLPDAYDHAIYGASKIAKGAVEFGKWSADMVKDLGDYVKPHLKDIWDASNKYLDEQVDKAPDAVKRAVKRTAPTLDETRAILVDHKPGTPFTPEQVKGLWTQAKTYLDGNTDFDDIRSKLATDLGLPVKEVTKGLLQNQKLKRLADDAWLKQRDARRLKEDARLWIASQSTPGILKIPKAVMREAFAVKVLGHVSVALGTHSPMLAYQPQYWGTFLRNYGQMWKIAVKPALHEMAMQDLTRRPNWTTARRAGLENDPFQHEEYDTHGLIDKALAPLSRSGNRAYDVLKLLRQDMFDQQWDKMADTVKTPERARGLAEEVNHVTGIVGKNPKSRLGKMVQGAGPALFAPRLLASRFAWAVGDPARAIATGARQLTDIVKGEKTVTPEDKAFAISQVREKATVVATMGAMLVANQAILSASGSKQKINFTDPTKSDWLKFKAAGLDISLGNAMLTTVRLPFREAAILLDNTIWNHGKRKFEGSDENTYRAIGEYFRNQLNPAVGDVADLAFQSDAQGRPLPWSKQKVPTYLKKQGVTKPYTWGEWARDATMPISLEESVKQVFNDYGVPKDQAEKWAKVIATAIYMGGTGGRISEDPNAKK